MTVVTNMHKTYMPCHDYEGVMLVLCTRLQVKCYPKNITVVHLKTKECQRHILIKYVYSIYVFSASQIGSVHSEWMQWTPSLHVLWV